MFSLVTWIKIVIILNHNWSGEKRKLVITDEDKTMSHLKRRKHKPVSSFLCVARILLASCASWTTCAPPCTRWVRAPTRRCCRSSESRSTPTNTSTAGTRVSSSTTMLARSVQDPPPQNCSGKTIKNIILQCWLRFLLLPTCTNCWFDSGVSVVISVNPRPFLLVCFWLQPFTLHKCLKTPSALYS